MTGRINNKRLVLVVDVKRSRRVSMDAASILYHVACPGGYEVPYRDYVCAVCVQSVCSLYVVCSRQSRARELQTCM